MPVIDHLDVETKRIYLASGVRSYHPVDDIYKEIRTLRAEDETLRGFDIPVIATGNVPKGGGKFTPRLAIFQLGWKVVPDDTSHVLEITGEQITDDGESGPAAIDFEPLTEGVKIVVNYQPPDSEVIVVSPPGGLTVAKFLALK
jgi:hypothetical protein